MRQAPSCPLTLMLSGMIFYFVYGSIKPLCYILCLLFLWIAILKELAKVYATRVTTYRPPINSLVFKPREWILFLLLFCSVSYFFPQRVTLFTAELQVEYFSEDTFFLPPVNSVFGMHLVWSLQLSSCSIEGYL